MVTVTNNEPIRPNFQQPEFSAIVEDLNPVTAATEDLMSDASRFKGDFMQPLELLPDDNLIYLCQWLDTPDIKALSSCSKSLRASCLTEIYFRSLPIYLNLPIISTRGSSLFSIKYSLRNLMPKFIETAMRICGNREIVSQVEACAQLQKELAVKISDPVCSDQLLTVSCDEEAYYCPLLCLASKKIVHIKNWADAISDKNMPFYFRVFLSAHACFLPQLEQVALRTVPEQFLQEFGEMCLLAKSLASQRFWFDHINTEFIERNCSKLSIDAQRDVKASVIVRRIVFQLLNSTQFVWPLGLREGITFMNSCRQTIIDTDVLESNPCLAAVCEYTRCLEQYMSSEPGIEYGKKLLQILPEAQKELDVLISKSSQQTKRCT